MTVHARMSNVSAEPRMFLGYGRNDNWQKRSKKEADTLSDHFGEPSPFLDRTREPSSFLLCLLCIQCTSENGKRFLRSGRLVAKRRNAVPRVHKWGQLLTWLAEEVVPNGSMLMCDVK